jgi:RNA polymerase sigma-70 factor (ECF subfamily)
VYELGLEPRADLPSDDAKIERFLRHLEPLQGALEAFCRRSLKDRNAVADVLQNAVANAFRDFRLYSEGTNFRAWIFRYTHLEILNSNRALKRHKHDDLNAEIGVEDAPPITLDEPVFKVLLDDPDLVLEQCDTALAQAIRELAPAERSVILLHAVGEFKYREIAEILHIPIGTVMSRLARCRVHLRQRLVQFAEAQGLLRSGEL